MLRGGAVELRHALVLARFSLLMVLTGHYLSRKRLRACVCTAVSIARVDRVKRRMWRVSPVRVSPPRGPRRFARSFRQPAVCAASGAAVGDGRNSRPLRTPRVVRVAAV